jgi:D-alanine-D-alanine ligase
VKKRLRVLVLVHQDLVPPDSIEGLSEKEIQPWKTEYHVVEALRELGHQAQVLGISDALLPIRSIVEGWAPDVVFNMLVEFRDVAAYQVHIVSYLEVLQLRYTGCNSRGILLARDKPLAKQIFRYHRIPTPAFAVSRLGRAPRLPGGLGFPLIVKSVDEEASLGLSQASVVRDLQQLAERVEFVHRHVETDAIIEEYVEGRELTIGVLGNDRLRAFPVWEMFFDKLPEGSLPIATARVKWDLEYQERVGIRTGPARRLPDGLAERIERIARRVYRCLGLSGYARIDLRLTPAGEISVIEANAVPDLAADEDYATSARAGGIGYGSLIQRILNLGLDYRSPWETS